MLDLLNIRKTFVKKGVFGHLLSSTVAVDDISLSLKPRQTLGVIGESGSGKSTLARVALRMISPDGGSVIFEGRDVTAIRGPELREFRRTVQPVFQDAAGALDPRMTIRSSLREPLVLLGDVDKEEFVDRIRAAMKSVDLSPELLDRMPGALSGGQRQRVGIARALLMKPKILILDEPISALDVSVQAQVLNLLRDLQAEDGLSYLFIGHDLSVAEYFCDEILVMHHGKRMEFANATELFRNPQSDYTKQLVAAMPRQL